MTLTAEEHETVVLATEALDRAISALKESINELKSVQRAWYLVDNSINVALYKLQENRARLVNILTGDVRVRMVATSPPSTRVVLNDCDWCGEKIDELGHCAGCGVRPKYCSCKQPSGVNA